MALKQIPIYDLGGGYNDQGSGIELPTRYQPNLENFYINRGDAKTRGGYSKRHAAALVASKAVQDIHQYTDNSGTSYIFYACNGKIFRDPMSGAAPTDITGSLTLSTDAAARFHLADFDGECYGTDGTNPLFYIASGSANGALWTPPGIPSKAAALNFHRLHAWLGNYTDTDGSARRYSTLHSSGGVPILFTGRMESGGANDYNRAETVIALKDYEDTQLVFCSGSIWKASFSPSREMGQVQSNFAYERHSGVGLAAAKSVVETPQGLFFLGKRGVYWIPPGAPVQRPQYVSKPIEGFWEDVDKQYLPYAVGAEMPEKNGVLFCVPHGSSQATNNRGIFLNYESWSRWGNEANDVHPAFAVFSGRPTQAFAFNALATITDTNGRERLLGGDYSGFIYDIDEGSLDNAADIRPIIRTPYIGSPTLEYHWQDVTLDCVIEEPKNIRALQLNYDRPTPYSQTVLGGQDSVLLGDFMLGTDYLGADALGPVRADLAGTSRWMQLELEILSGAPFTLHGLTIQAEPGHTI